MSASVFVLSGTSLRALLSIDGPMASVEEINSGAELIEASKQFNRKELSKRQVAPGIVHFSYEVDFEHLNFKEDYERDDDDEFDDEEPEGETPEERKVRIAKIRKKYLERIQRKEKQKADNRNAVRDQGEPYVKTMKVEQGGWYRICVRSSSSEIDVEMEVRKESEYDGLNEEGNVNTYEDLVMKREYLEIDGDTASEEGIKDEDFKLTKEKLKAMRKLLADIQTKQQQERRRMLLHTSTNEHSHSRMVLNSLMETVLFMAVTGFQVWTIRRWFKGAPQLGR